VEPHPGAYSEWRFASLFSSALRTFLLELHSTLTPLLPSATQYKLDILQFADEYDVVLWLDSDTIVVRTWAAVVLRRGSRGWSQLTHNAPPNNALQYDDLRPLLFAFYKSPAKYMFVRDHVCFLPEFLNNYPFKTNKGSAFVPQVHS
jgi:hypothetical protein